MKRFPYLKFRHYIYNEDDHAVLQLMGVPQYPQSIPKESECIFIDNIIVQVKGPALGKAYQILHMSQLERLSILIAMPPAPVST